MFTLKQSHCNDKSVLGCWWLSTMCAQAIGGVGKGDNRAWAQFESNQAIFEYALSSTFKCSLKINETDLCRALGHKSTLRARHFGHLASPFDPSLVNILYPVWKRLTRFSGQHRGTGITHNDSLTLFINGSRRWQGPFMTKTEIFSSPHPTLTLHCFANLLGTTWKSRLRTVSALPGNNIAQRLLQAQRVVYAKPY